MNLSHCKVLSSWGRGVGRGSVALLILFLLLSGLLPLFSPLCGYRVVHASSHEVEKQLALSFLQHAAGLDLADYVPVSSSAYGYVAPVSNRYEVDVRIILNHSSSTFEVSALFVEGQLSLYNLRLLSGQMDEEKTLTDSLSIASRVAEGYGTLFNKTYCDDTKSMISTAIQSQSITVDNANARLEIEYAEDCSTPQECRGRTKLHWFKKFGGNFTHNMQSIGIYISKDGLLTTFMDNLAVYHVATTTVSVSEEEAINTSLPYAAAYADEHGREILTTSATLRWDVDTEARRGDNSAMYPVWVVTTYYDDANNESVYGYAVGIWADNGGVSFYGPQGRFSDTGTYDNPYQWLLVTVIVVACVFGPLAIYIRSRKREP